MGRRNRQAGLLPVFGDQRDSGGHRFARATDAHFAAVHEDLSRVYGIDTENSAAGLRAAGADESCQSDDLSRAQRER